MKAATLQATQPSVGGVSPTASVRRARTSPLAGSRWAAPLGAARGLEPQLACRRSQSMGLAISRSVVGRTQVRASCRAMYSPCPHRSSG
jgi:hypothetical protein